MTDYGVRSDASRIRAITQQTKATPKTMATDPIRSGAVAVVAERGGTKTTRWTCPSVAEA